MRRPIWFVLALLLGAGSALHGKKPDHQWSIGKVLNESRARYFAGMNNNSSSETIENGTLNASANSTSIGSSTDTEINGQYSGTSTTSTSGTSTPIYKVYDNLVIEGSDTVYFSSERLSAGPVAALVPFAAVRFHTSKGPHVAVNDTVKYYVDGKKLHILDEDNKEHTVEIVSEIRKVPSPAALDANPSRAIQAVAVPSVQGSVTIESVPSGADIEIDGAFVGNTPSTISLAPGSHQIAVQKKGFTDWAKTLSVTGGTVHLNAELEREPEKH